MERSDSRKGMLLMLACTLFWSISGLLIRLTPWNSFVLAGGRSLLAACVVGLYMRSRRMPLVLTRMSVQGAVSLSVVFFLFMAANKMTTSANAIVLQECAPAVVLLYNIVFGKARARRVDIFTVAATLAGILLFFLDKLSAGSLVGNTLALLSGLVLAVNYITQGLSTSDECMSGILLAHLLTAAVGLPFAARYDTPLNASTLSVIALLGVVQLGIPYILYGLATRRCPPLAISLIGMAEAVFNPIWVALALGEVPGPVSLAGGALVLGATAYWAVKTS